MDFRPADRMGRPRSYGTGSVAAATWTGVAGVRVAGVRVAVSAAALVAAVALGGCASVGLPGVPGGAAGDTDADTVARAQVAEFVREMGDVRPRDIDGWARAAVETAAGAGTSAGASSIQLIGIEPLQTEVLAEPFGRLAFRVPTSERSIQPTDGVGLAYLCYRVPFDYYGKAGDFGSTDAVERFDCPADAAPVTPPPDTTITPVVVANTREVARAVLLERAAGGAPATSDQIAAAIAARLGTPTGAYEVAALPTVLVDSSSTPDRVGVAVGTGSDCVLLKSANGVVEDVYPAAVLLQPGELGCGPETALADPDDLRSPH